MINSIQYLRAVAALFVVMHHILLLVGKYHTLNFTFELGNSGVDLFFIISGFIMMEMHNSDFNQNKSYEFIKKRIIRIVPLYWFYTTIFLVLLIFIPSLFSTLKINNLFWVLSSYLFIPAESFNGLIAPILNVGWTLNYEMFFYLIFAIFLFFDKKYIVYLFIYFVALVFVSSENVLINFYSNSIILEFLLGISAYFLIHNIKANLMLSISIFFIGILLLISCSYFNLTFHRFYLYGIPMFLIFWSIVNIDVNIYKFKAYSIIVIGYASYSLYLSHIFSIYLIAFFIKAPFLLFLIAFSFAVLVSLFSYKFIEKPIDNYLKKKLK